MWFILLKIFKFGFSQAKKQHAKKNNPNGNPDDTTNPSSIPMAARSFLQPTPPPPPKPLKYYLGLALHAVQLIFGIAVLALYSSDIHNAHERGDSASPEWVFAVVTAFLGCVTAMTLLVYVAFLKQRSVGGKAGILLGLFAWQALGVILWLVVFGIFAGKFLGTEKKKMRRAVWVDLVCLVLAVGGTAWAWLRWWRNGRGRAAEEDVVGKDREVEEKEVV
ncbi:uncharacterized protein KD926_008755 [Aspergillus affinis]|uniref:uncharacterized protein n=1 Tax=Aspergillus affinis TaxID=1070780 RepID=UPI0022FE68E1|nr:uncharacterized protein KD926_008755 [Aspergillus affinis]KAI9045329.1 hypothetical protein KD926_008755 [Aspergillus affinis]